jgi:hypothetical protein
MRPDPSPARAAPPPVRQASTAWYRRGRPAAARPAPIESPAEAPVPLSLSTRLCVTAAAVAFFLVPGRFLLVWLVPAAAPFLGFGV